ncbi:hypothetical protein AC579_931 [Pseudocercospora musae]|uniref:J domain-containing protein n=1 Tax=Pseudocercospora musae TaxID=113226 RepID=A0A139I0Q8_9PEZI|nr:hypothetical protein AC579_931 [Pseudocercospora musae]
MDHITKLRNELEQAQAAGDKLRVARLVRIINMEERKARTRASREEDAQRKAREDFLPYSKASTPRSGGPVAAKLPPMAYFNDLEDQVKREEEARQAASRKAQDEARRREKIMENARRQAEEQHQRAQDQQRQRESRFRDEERQRQRQRQQKEKKKSNRSTPPNAPRRTLPPGPAVTMPQIKEWYAFAEACNNAREKVQTFPLPPDGCCGSTTCASQDEDRSNKACECNIRRCFKLAGVGIYKKEMLKWHPDKWSRSPENQRENFQKLAREIFIVLKDM